MLVLKTDSGRQRSARQYNPQRHAEEGCSAAHPNAPPLGQRFLRERLIEWVAIEGFQCLFDRHSSSLARKTTALWLGKPPTELIFATGDLCVCRRFRRLH
jgi:hypothetical protein